MDEIFPRLIGTLQTLLRFASKVFTINGDDEVELRDVPTDELATLVVGGLLIPTEAEEGQVLTSDADGYATWQAPEGGSGGNTNEIQGVYIENTPVTGQYLRYGTDGFEYEGSEVSEGSGHTNSAVSSLNNLGPDITNNLSYSTKIVSVTVAARHAGTWTVNIVDMSDESIVATTEAVYTASPDGSLELPITGGFVFQAGRTYRFRVTRAEGSANYWYRGEYSSSSFSFARGDHGSVVQFAVRLKHIIGTPAPTLNWATILKHSNVDVSSPPTKAELTSIYGNPTLLRDGYLGVVDDAGAATTVYLVTVSNDEFFYQSLTKAT